MHELSSDVLLELIAATNEPLVLVHVDSPDWLVVLENPAFSALTRATSAIGRPFPDVIEPMVGRELTREASGALRTGEAVSLPVDVHSREFLLTLIPVGGSQTTSAAYYAAFWRTAGCHLPFAGRQSLRSLARATRRARELSGDDPVTGLMNERSFRSVLEHDWAVASREDATIGLSAFRLDDFDAYVAAFGRHGADVCLRRVAAIVSRSLRRASDVAARIEASGGGRIVVLSHGSGDSGLAQFGDGIARLVRDLGLHHPRSTVARYVTVSHRFEAIRPHDRRDKPSAVLGRLLGA